MKKKLNRLIVGVATFLVLKGLVRHLVNGFLGGGNDLMVTFVTFTLLFISLLTSIGFSIWLVEDTK